jgi:hypothetical protein
MDGTQAKDLCLSLMKADSEDEVIQILKDAGYWDDDDAWRFYGDRETNYNAIGNQQSKPEAALVEKLVNSVDARLMNECLARGIEPEGSTAPQSIRDAVARFFDENPNRAIAGHIREWDSSKRTEVARGITLAATGAKPGDGDPCFTISDQGEGQTPEMMPETILSLDKSNKLRIPFVQGKFNMGGTGALEFCGRHNLQLVLSRRNPALVYGDQRRPSDAQWSFTVVRREDPKENERSSIYTYLAPVESRSRPRSGILLSFASETMPIFPQGRDAYGRPAEWGTLIKLYEYSATGFRSNILFKDGLMRRVDLLLPDVALPIRFHECRSYSGHEGSFENTLTGVRVRLEDNRAENLEYDPWSFSMTVHGEEMTGTIYAFKKNRADTYRKSEGIIFSVNGQTHGYLTTDFFSRKRIGLGYLRDSILVLIDCSKFSNRARERLFMNSRDRLRGGELRSAIESELEDTLKQDRLLRELKEHRRREEIEGRLDDAKPLEEILKPLIEKSPSLSSLFLQGRRVPNPFRTKTVGSQNTQFEGKNYPTYFKFKGKNYGTELYQDCPINMRSRISFETDASNDYLSRETDPGEFTLYLVSDSYQTRVEDSTVNLQNGIATLNVRLPINCQVGDRLRFVARVEDSTQLQAFENHFVLSIKAAQEPNGSRARRRKPPVNQSGNDRETPSGIEMPSIIKVHEHPTEGGKSWEEMSPPFDKYSALRVIHGGTSTSNGSSRDIYDFYINADNVYLKTEMKPQNQEADVIDARFTYGMVLVGLALIQEDSQNGPGSSEGKGEADDHDGEAALEKRIEDFSRAVAPVLLPMIEHLGGLDAEEDVVSVDSSGEAV